MGRVANSRFSKVIFEFFYGFKRNVKPKNEQETNKVDKTPS